jgi:single-stranded-DNA-specific exonuclease
MPQTPVEFCNTISLKGREWHYQPLPEGVVPYANVDKTIAELIVSRGFDQERFFNPSFAEEMPDPSTLIGMDAAVSAFCDAVQAGKKIAIFGDYDVDGATSTAIVLRWLRHVGREAVFYIPDREKEGYGPNVNAIRKLHEEFNSEFLLLLDTGTTAHESVNLAVELGMEVVIIDHHLQDANDPNAVLVNPNQRAETGDFHYLCTVGLAFLFLVGVQREMRKRNFFNERIPQVDLRKWLGLVALGTVADLMLLKGLNRAYVANGLAKMENIPGLVALAELNKNKKTSAPAPYTARNCGFVFGPCLNATGRISDTRMATLLLLTDDEQEAMKLAREAVETNLERQAMTELAKDEAIKQATTIYKDDPVLMLYDKSWHPGINGVVAGRVKEATNKPVIICGTYNYDEAIKDGSQLFTGSARTVDNFDIGGVVIAAKKAEIVVKGGGHKMAAGVTLAEARIPEFRAFLNEAAKNHKAPPLQIDLVIPCGKLNVELMNSIEMMAPFGNGNPEPRIALVGGYISRVEVFAENSLRVHVAGEFGIATCNLWRGVGTPLGNALMASKDRFVDLYGVAKLNTFRTQTSAQLNIEDAMIKGWSSEQLAA